MPSCLIETGFLSNKEDREALMDADYQSRIVEGHAIGIHCDNHDYNKLYKCVDSYVADFEQAYETVYEITGEKVRLFRFPGGSINAYNKKVYQDIKIPDGPTDCGGGADTILKK